MKSLFRPVLSLLTLPIVSAWGIFDDVFLDIYSQQVKGYTVWPDCGAVDFYYRQSNINITAPSLFEPLMVAYAGSANTSLDRFNNIFSFTRNKSENLSDYVDWRNALFQNLNIAGEQAQNVLNFWGQYNYFIYDDFRNSIENTLQATIKPTDFENNLTASRESYLSSFNQLCTLTETESSFFCSPYFRVPSYTRFLASHLSRYEFDWQSTVLTRIITQPFYLSKNKIIRAYFGDYQEIFNEFGEVVDTIYSEGPEVTIETGYSLTDFISFTGVFNCYADQQIRMAEIALGGGKHSLFVIIPKETDGLDDFESNLSWASFQAMRAAATPEKTNVAIPATNNLSHAFIDEGFRRDYNQTNPMPLNIFQNNSSDLSAIHEQGPIYIPDFEIITQLSISIDGIAIESHAFTSIWTPDLTNPPGIGNSSQIFDGTGVEFCVTPPYIDEERPNAGAMHIDYHANRPSLLLVVDNEQNALVSLLRIADPGAAKAYETSDADHWLQSDWFGQFWRHTETNWHYHETLGWIWLKALESAGCFFYKSGLGHCWTSADVYPNFYNPDSGWSYLKANNAGELYRYSYDNSNWTPVITQTP